MDTCKRTLIRNPSLDLTPPVGLLAHDEVSRHAMYHMKQTKQNKKNVIFFFYFAGAAKTLSWHLSSENSTKANAHKPTFA